MKGEDKKSLDLKFNNNTKTLKSKKKAQNYLVVAPFDWVSLDYIQNRIYLRKSNPVYICNPNFPENGKRK